jgi:hypothetical protein
VRYVFERGQQNMILQVSNFGMVETEHNPVDGWILNRREIENLCSDCKRFSKEAERSI